MSHISLFVLDQEKAYDFYVKKLGFKVNTDVVMPGHDTDGKPAKDFRWLTLNPPEQPDLEIILMPVDQNMDAEDQKAIKHLLEKGIMGAGVWHTNDCRATYEELKKKDVDISEPKEQFYGIECIMKDGCGNWFSMTEPKEVPAGGWS
jgi:catechol 2,3-dioxygenase-like lactoylglutathione lyase family enzyme